VEVLSTCPTNWGMKPSDSLEWLKNNMMETYPLGDLKTPEGVE
jgi:2-oxoglutarate ferredoxin oxidoreductase subunit beta